MPPLAVVKSVPGGVKINMDFMARTCLVSLDQILSGVLLPEWQQDEGRAFMKASLVNSLSISMSIALGTHADK